jgi:hypothetical protein
VGVSKLGGIFVHKFETSRYGEKSTSSLREPAMQEALHAAQEAEVQQLAEAIAQAASAEFLQLARTLVGSGASPFGEAEFTIRDILLRVGAKAYEQHLAQKKTATKAPA